MPKRFKETIFHIVFPQNNIVNSSIKTNMINYRTTKSIRNIQCSFIFNGIIFFAQKTFTTISFWQKSRVKDKMKA